MPIASMQFSQQSFAYVSLEVKRNITSWWLMDMKLLKLTLVIFLFITNCSFSTIKYSWWFCGFSFGQMHIHVCKYINFILYIDVKLETTHFNALLSVYIQNRHKFSPLEFLADMQESKIQPDKVCFLLFLCLPFLNRVCYSSHDLLNLFQSPMND